MSWMLQDVWPDMRLLEYQFVVEDLFDPDKIKVSSDSNSSERRVLSRKSNTEHHRVTPGRSQVYCEISQKLVITDHFVNTAKDEQLLAEHGIRKCCKILPFCYSLRRPEHVKRKVLLIGIEE